MSQTAKSAREAMKAKAKRLASADPHTKVDSSTWTPPEPLDADIKTGMRPLTKRAYKKGGKVIGKAEGEKSERRADRKPREAGGRTKRYLTPDNLINRDEKMANDVREGKKHVGGLKRGGPAKKFGGGETIGDNPISLQGRSMGQAAGMMKKGGKVKGRERHSGMDGDNVVGKDPIGDLIRKLPQTGQKNVPAEERAVPVRKKPTVDDYLMRSNLDEERAANAKAFDEEQKKYLRDLPQNQKRGGKVAKAEWEHSKKDLEQDKLLAKKYGISMEKWEKSKEDKKHDKQQSMKGLKKGGAAHGDDCSCKMCSGGRTMKYKGGGVFSGESYPGKVPGATGGREAHKKGGKAGKGKMNVNIIIASGHRGQGQDSMPNAPVPAPLSPRTPPAGGGAPMPPPGMMPPGAGPGAGPMPPPGMMPRKYGGRTTHVIDHAAGGGLGRLEKIKAYGLKQAKGK